MNKGRVMIPKIILTIIRPLYSVRTTNAIAKQQTKIE